MGWGWARRRKLWIPLDGGEKVECHTVPVKRFRCRQCARTWCLLPPLLVCWKRYAAAVIQGCWESWADGYSYEATAEAWHLRCVRTVQRWLQPLAANADTLKAEVRRLLVGEEPAEVDNDTMRSGSRSAVSNLLRLTKALVHQARLAPADLPRVPYHFVMRAASVSFSA